MAESVYHSYWNNLPTFELFCYLFHIGQVIEVTYPKWINCSTDFLIKQLGKIGFRTVARLGYLIPVFCKHGIISKPKKGARIMPGRILGKMRKLTKTFKYAHSGISL